MYNNFLRDKESITVLVFVMIGNIVFLRLVSYTFVMLQTRKL
jgi:hypothetical protein